MEKELKIGKEAIFVNMEFIHKGYDKSDTLFSTVKIEKITEDRDGELWINSNLRQKYTFKDTNEAKKFVSDYLKKEILRVRKQILHEELKVNYYQEILLAND